MRTDRVTRKPVTRQPEARGRQGDAEVCGKARLPRTHTKSP
jgi:hypothetical protein